MCATTTIGKEVTCLIQRCTYNGQQYKRVDNLNMAFKAVEKVWGIPALVDAVDFVSVPDGVSMILYLHRLFVAFTKSSN
jgi:hypothetical protein